MAQLLSSFEIGKLPLYSRSRRIAGSFQSPYLPLQGLPVAYPSAQTITLENTQLDLGHVKPTGVLGRVGKAQLPGDPPGLLWRKSLIERGRRVGVEIVENKFDPFGFGVAFIYQPFEDAGKIKGGAPLCHDDVAQARQWLEDNEQIGRASPLVLIIYPLGYTWPDTLRWSYLGQQLFNFLIQADYRMIGVVVFFVEIQHSFHTRYETTIYFRDAPLLVLPGFNFTFFKTWRIVSGETLSTSSSSTIRSASMRTVQWSLPSGTGLQAVAMMMAS